MLVNPMPHMQRQNDLNCGYFCERALLAYWFQRLNNNQSFRHLRLDKTKLLGYEPHGNHRIEDLDNLIYKDTIPRDLQTWEDLLNKVGPVIVSGKLGGADWGTWKLPTPMGTKKWKAGCGHFVLIVGTDLGANKICYKDPLQGDVIKSKDYGHTAKRIDQDCFYIPGQNAAKGIFDALGST